MSAPEIDYHSLASEMIREKCTKKFHSSGGGDGDKYQPYPYINLILAQTEGDCAENR